RDDLQKLVLDRVLDKLWVPLIRAVIDQRSDQSHQLRVWLVLLDVSEIIAIVAHFVAIAQRPQDNALAARLKHHGAFAAIKDDAGYADFLRGAHRIADDRESFL